MPKIPEFEQQKQDFSGTTPNLSPYSPYMPIVQQGFNLARVLMAKGSQAKRAQDKLYLTQMQHELRERRLGEFDQLLSCDITADMKLTHWLKII